MNIFKPFLQLIARLRYPVSMPADVASDLGIDISNSMKFQDFIHCLTDPRYRPTKLTRFMSREQAEDIFRLAKRKERFQQSSLFSYYFKGGWVEFNLQFDDQSRLRRVYICHCNLKQRYEISIAS